ncbi:hypothetical protein LINPERHAP2_LOCUS11576 [Linum perenne]
MTSGHTIPMSETVNCQAIIISRPESDPPHNSAQRSNLLQEHQMIPFNYPLAAQASRFGWRQRRGWVEAERMGQQGEAAEKDEKVDVVVERVDGGER